MTENKMYAGQRFLTAISALLLVLALSMAATPAQAGLQGQIDSMFNTMSNVTDPTAVMGQRRGVLAGGRYSVRSNIMDIQIITAIPPSINAGCAGIDLFGGSFSFISAEQFVQSLRAIAANAAGYAFKVAMDTMCPTCASVMASLRKLMNTMNSMATNSCESAEALVNLVSGQSEDSTQAATKKEAAGWAQHLGSAVDNLAAWYDTVGKNGSSLNKVAATEEGKKTLEDEGVIGNVVWQALNEGGVADWWSGGDIQFLEAVMSVSGSIVITPSEDEDSDAEPDIQPLEPVLSIDSFLNGVSAGGDTTKVQVYKCNGGEALGRQDYNSCYDPGVIDTQVASFRAKVKEKMRSIVKKYITNTAFSNEELAFIQHAPGSVGAMLRNLAVITPGMAQSYANQASGIVAQIMAANLVLDMMTTAKMAMASSTAPTAKQMRGEFGKVADALQQQAMRAQGELQNLASLVSTYNSFMSASQKRRMGLGSLLDQTGGEP